MWEPALHGQKHCVHFFEVYILFLVVGERGFEKVCCQETRLWLVPGSVKKAPFVPEASMVSAGLGVGGPGAGCWFSPCLMIRFRSTSITYSAGRDAAKVEASVLPASVPVAEGGEGVRPNVAVSVAVVVLPLVGAPVVVEDEDEGCLGARMV